MDKKELEHFCIGNLYGGKQSLFKDITIKYGGCAALAACDVCIYLAKYTDMEELYPFDPHNVTLEEYFKFGKIMKAYLRPRIFGIFRLKTFVKGFEKYIKSKGQKLGFVCIEGGKSFEEAKAALKRSIKFDIPVICLLLLHKDKTFKGYTWHWFLINGCRAYDDFFEVKAVTYGGYRWLNFKKLWDTGHILKGGLVIIGH